MSTKKLGVMLPNLGPSQLNYYFIKNGNLAVSQRKVGDLVAFVDQPAKPCLHMLFSTMPMAEAWGYDGVLVATNLLSAARLAEFPSAQRKLFYVWDLEWTCGQPAAFKHYQAVYNHPNLELLARSREHADLIARCWNRPCLAIVDDFDLEQILSL